VAILGFVNAVITFTAQGAVEFSEKPMHSYIWRIRLRKDRKYEICPAGGIKK
jgi:hypothetical protein